LGVQNALLGYDVDPAEEKDLGEQENLKEVSSFSQ